MRHTRLQNGLARPALGLLLAALAAFPAAPLQAQTPLVKNGDSIAFLGDSITQGGWHSPVGYVRLVMSGLECNGLHATAIPAGISGHKSNDMLARLRKDVLDKNPVWMTLSCGVNDVWHGANGVPLPQYKANITAIIDRAQASGIKVMILTATVITEQEDNPNNRTLVAYNEFLRELAKEKKCPLADLNADMWAGLKAAPGQKNVFTGDGVHMNAHGNCLMAAGVLRAFGLSEEQIGKAREAWAVIPNAVSLNGQKGITLRQYEQLRVTARQRETTVEEMANAAFSSAVSNLLANPPR
jgi:lysophospholipase L1-like esterase